MDDEWDVIVIGGAFAGLSAALQVARGRRRVLVIDAGSTRNRNAAHAHGLLASDGAPPGRIRATAAAELLAYPTAAVLDDTAVTAVVDVSSSPDSPRFEVSTSTSKTLTARRIVLAAGVVDSLPDLPGIAAAWGRGVFHCPYCHGYEVRDLPLAVLNCHAMASPHQAFLIRHWSDDITFFAGGSVGAEDTPDVADDVLAKMTRLGVKVERTPVKSLVVADDGGLNEVELQDGRRLPMRGMLLAPKVSHSAAAVEIYKGLGVEIGPGKFGYDVVTTHGLGETSAKGVFAAGDCAGALNLATAVGDGSMAGIAAHQSLVAEEVASA